MCVAAAAFASASASTFCCAFSCAFDYPPSPDPPPPLLPPPLRAAKAHATVGCASCGRKRLQTHENEEKLTSIKSQRTPFLTNY
eukprot:COSAG06_NODE_417_length_15986_cov_832.025493_21_plen_84_part_00